MISRPPAYLMFGLDENIQLVWYFLRRGFGGPLLFLWSLGVGIFLLVLGSTLSAVAWTGLAALTGAWMIYRCRYDPRVLDELIRSTMAERFPWRDLADAGLREAVKKSCNMVVEVTLKVYSLGRSSEARDELNRVLTAASRMLELQLELAHKAESLTQGLGLIDPSGRPAQSLITDAPELHCDTVAAVQKQIEHARTLISDICRQLETLTLQVYQLETLSDIPSGADQLAREIELNLDWVQEKISVLNRPTTIPEVRHSPSDFQTMSESLKAGFHRNGCKPGIKALQQLTHEYTQFQATLDRWKEDNPMLVGQIPDLTEETYRQGLRFLRHALDLVQAIRSTNGGRLEEETLSLEQEIEHLKSLIYGSTNDPSQTSRLEVLYENLESHRRILNLLQQQSMRVEELLGQTRRCEASLNQARMQLVLLSASESPKGSAAVTETLSRVIEEAKEVQQELQELGF